MEDTCKGFVKELDIELLSVQRHGATVFMERSLGAQASLAAHSSVQVQIVFFIQTQRQTRKRELWSIAASAYRKQCIGVTDFQVIAAQSYSYNFV